MKRPPSMLTAPWLISQEGAALVWGVWSRGEMFADVVAKARAAAPGPYSNGSGALRVENRVAIIDVTGPIFRKASLFSDLSGATTDEALRRALAQAVADPSVDAIVLDVDSPGGEAAGAAETAQAIRAADAVKPVVVYTGGMAASKAYWFASAARWIVAAEDAHVGSVGARVSIVDDSAAEAAAGFKTFDVVSGVSPDKRNLPIDEAVIAVAQRSVDDIAAVFVAHVATGRRTTPEAVARDFGRGACVIASRAIEAGMIDQIGSMSDAVARAMSDAMRSRR